MPDETTLERCPTCGQLGCVGYCDADDLYDEPPAYDCRCTICGVNWVDAANGYDTCPTCLGRQ